MVMVTVMVKESKKSNRTRPALSFVFLLGMRDEDESSGKGEKGKINANESIPAIPPWN